MKNKFQFFVVAILSLVMISCSSKPVEKYSDYFYVTRDDAGKEQFTYILYLGGASEAHEGPSEHSSGVPQRQRAKGAESRDDFMSISFKMEEEAFKRLAILLEEKEFCDSEVEYESNEYTWLKYTIIGQCQK